MKKKAILFIHKKKNASWPIVGLTVPQDPQLSFTTALQLRSQIFTNLSLEQTSIIGVTKL